MDTTDTKELPREMSAADVAEETKADVEAVKSVEDATLRSRQKLIFLAPSNCPIDLFGPVAKGRILKRLHIKSQIQNNGY